MDIPRVKLGTQGLQVSKLGFGCAGLSGVFEGPVPDEVVISLFKEAFSKGITFSDTSDFYGPHTNEVSVGKLPRDEVQLATKFGVVKVESNNAIVRGDPEYVRSCCEVACAVLVWNILISIHTSVPIEETGKVKYIGLSEASPDTIRRAHAVHPITALQMEWSLWSREIEDELLPLCRHTVQPRFQGQNFDKNKTFYFRIEKLAEKHGCTTAQLLLHASSSRGRCGFHPW
uniref:NADP-dependent oxidoreductase domain-containing protein n=1 Tax=Phaseolus vulgaris TaxID=3885 RepID=V7BIL5_PHAVU|nr:hypothetical protein PHAVU_007G187100g [Phaseolus vulgaris]ESW16818.1 hypothetical protein PHAVU_007G187100g [Phaseolus vulgaris]